MKTLEELGAALAVRRKELGLKQRTVAKRAWLLAAMSKLDPTEQQTLISAAALIKRLGES